MHKTARRTFRDLLDASTKVFDGQLAEFFEPDEELVYQVRTPTDADSAEPPGVVIYISPKPGARMPDAWGEVLDKHNLVWVGAQDSGNEVHVARRIGFALLAPTVAAQVVAIDTSRTFVLGFSGGGRVASMMIPAYPGQFAGAMFICGANPLFTATQQTIDELNQLPIIFLTGTGDFNLEDTRMALPTWQQAGVSKAQLMVVDGLGHALPAKEDFDVALESLVLPT